jgi:hypothetical protein
MAELPTRAPLALHEQVIERHHGRDRMTREIVPDADIQLLSGAFASARRASEALCEQARALRQDVTKTPEARAAQIRQASLRVAERVARSLDEARARIADTAERLASATSGPALPKSAHEVALHGEIRARLSAMKPEDRRAALNQALEAGDDMVVGAALAAPGLVSGLAAEEVSMYRARFREARHPAEADRLRRLEAALADTDRAGQSFLSFTRAFDTSEARTAQEAADAATAATTAAVEARTGA